MHCRSLVAVIVVGGGLMAAGVGYVRASEGRQYYGAVPEPLAYQKLMVERSLLGRAAGVVKEAMRLITGVRESPHSMELWHADEARHPEWAPAMEGILRDRFASEVLSGLDLVGMRLVGHDCRTSTCRLEIEWPAELGPARPEGDGSRDPLRRLIRRQGPLATGTSSHGLPEREQIGSRVLVRLLLFFGPEAIDPNRYGQWVVQTRDRSLPLERARGALVDPDQPVPSPAGASQPRP